MLAKSQNKRSTMNKPDAPAETTHFGYKDVPVEQTLDQIGRALNEVARYGEGFGVEIRLEVHGRGTAHLPHIKTIMDVADSRNAVVCWNCNAQENARSRERLRASRRRSNAKLVRLGV